MSTKKEGGSVKEKRGTSPSQRRSSPGSSKTRSPPNYLKPTFSSSAGDASKLQARKQVDSSLKSNSNSNSNSNLARRRSFEKPPSPTRTLKTRGVSPTTTSRSPSFSGKTNNTSPVGSKDSGGKQHSLYARPAKKSSTSLGKKAGTQTASSRKQPKQNNHKVRDVQEHVEEADDQKVVLEQDDAEIGKGDDADNGEDVSPTNAEQDDDDDDDDGDGDVVSEPGEEMEKEEPQRKEGSGSGNDDTNPDESKEEEEEEEEAAASEVEDGGEGEEEATKVGEGKKETGLSNEVIEETASKLQKQSSRVRALAGAFETVISLQDPK